MHAHPLHPVQLGRAVRPLLPPGVRQVLRPYAHTARAFRRCAGVRPLARLHQPARHAHHGRMQQRHRRIGPPIFARWGRANPAESPVLHCVARHSVGRRRGTESVWCGLGADLANGGTAKIRGGGGGRTTVVRCWGWAHLPAGVYQPGTHHNFCTVSVQYSYSPFLIPVCVYQCCGSGMFIPDPNFFPSRIPDPGPTRFPDPHPHQRM